MGGEGEGAELDGLAGLQGKQVCAFFVLIGEGEVVAAILKGVDDVACEVLARGNDGEVGLER